MTLPKVQDPKSVSSIHRVNGFLNTCDQSYKTLLVKVRSNPLLVLARRV